MHIRSAVAAVALALAPEILWAQYVSIQEDFTTSPAARGWTTHGEASLFNWDSTAKKLAVTWDSAKPNSYFNLPLPAPLTAQHDFVLEFDFELSDFAAGLNPGKVSNFPIGLGMIQKNSATQPGFMRGFGTSAHLVEFSFWPDPGGDWLWGASVSSVLIDSTGFGWAYGDSDWGLTSNTVYHVIMDYDALGKVLRTRVTTNGMSCGAVDDARLSDAHEGYTVDHLSITSYSEEGQDPAYAGSVLAHGWVDNLQLTVAPRIQPAGTGGVRLLALANFSYTLQRSVGGGAWEMVGEAVPGNAEPLTLSDPNPPAGGALYRVMAQAR